MAALRRVFGGTTLAPPSSRPTELSAFATDLCRLLDGVNATTTVAGTHATYQLDAPAPAALYAPAPRPR